MVGCHLERTAEHIFGQTNELCSEYEFTWGHPFQQNVYVHDDAAIA
jgi:hypothetical protein